MNECNFKKYGFEKPDFECELWCEKDNYIFGIAKDIRANAGYWHPFIWDKKGNCYDSSHYKKVVFDLTPIKNKWYKDDNNVGKLIINRYGEVRRIQSIDTNKISTYQQNMYHDIIQAYGWRPLTKEEVLSMLVEEK